VTDTTTDTDPAEYDDYRPGCILSDASNNYLGTLPLAAWPQLLAWHRNPQARPLMFRDDYGQVVRYDRACVARIYRRDLDAVVALEAMDRERAATWSDDG
jgi:hypothetical protein